MFCYNFFIIIINPIGTLHILPHYFSVALTATNVREG